ncbi:hypothetical protein [Cohnella soli]|uniref:Uncharacterized protein n=1 Tax=Cohnella soli TaxID=425005 RepID=A0ABW0HQD0_9BACL
MKSNRKGPPTIEDGAAIKANILAALAFAKLQRDIKVIVASVKSPEPYVTLLSQAKDIAETEWRKSESLLRNRGIEIYKRTHLKESLEVKYLCGNYDDSASYRWNVLGVDVRRMISDYLAQQYDTPTPDFTSLTAVGPH